MPIGFILLALDGCATTPNMACIVGSGRCLAVGLHLQRTVYDKVPGNSDVEPYPYEYPVGATISVFGGDSAFRVGLQAGPGMGGLVAGFQSGGKSLMGWGTVGKKGVGEKLTPFGGIAFIQSREVKENLQMPGYSISEGVYEYFGRNNVPLLQDKAPNSPPSLVGVKAYYEIGVGGFLRMTPAGFILEARIGEDISNRVFRTSGSVGGAF